MKITMKKALSIICLLAAMTLLSSCAKKPEDSDIKAAIELSLKAEYESACNVTNEAMGESVSISDKDSNNVVLFAFDDIQVPMRKAGKAWAVIWNEDKSVQRNYVIEYDKKDKAFKVVSYTECVFDESTNSYIERK